MFKLTSELNFLGLKDYQVPALSGKHLDEDIDVHNVDGDKILAILQLSYQILHLLFLLLIAAVPVLFLNLPVGILAGLYAEGRRKSALAKSKVKIRAYDVSYLGGLKMYCLANHGWIHSDGPTKERVNGAPTHSCFNGVPTIGDAHGKGCLLYRDGANTLDDVRLDPLLLYGRGWDRNRVSNDVDASFCVSYSAHCVLGRSLMHSLTLSIDGVSTQKL